MGTPEPASWEVARRVLHDWDALCGAPDTRPGWSWPSAMDITAVVEFCATLSGVDPHQVLNVRVLVLDSCIRFQPDIKLRFLPTLFKVIRHQLAYWFDPDALPRKHIYSFRGSFTLQFPNGRGFTAELFLNQHCGLAKVIDPQHHRGPIQSYLLHLRSQQVPR